MARMSASDDDATRDRISANIYVVGHQAGTSELIDVPHLPQSDLDEISALMNALAHLRETERVLAEASRAFMQLSEQDMRALHYLIVAKRQDDAVTPSMLASYLKISAASTTKLLNRLESGGHLTRRMHPSDRRAFVIEITSETEASAKETVGKQQARRFYSAARLTSAEREVVTRFLLDMAEEISLPEGAWPEHPSR